MAWDKKPAQLLVDVVLFLTFTGVAGHGTYRTWVEGRLDYVEVAFAVQNAIMVSLILLRRQHERVDTSPLHQGVAIVAFMSGMAFIGQPPSGGPALLVASGAVTFAANVLGAFTLLNLGRSFGILIALRKVKTGGLYRIVRHPMYATDILLRVGFLLSHFNAVTAALFVVSTAAYVYRALLEERFLSQQPEYRAYMAVVRDRFVPFVF